MKMQADDNNEVDEEEQESKMVTYMVPLDPLRATVTRLPTRALFQGKGMNLLTLLSIDGDRNSSLVELSIKLWRQQANIIHHQVL